MAGILRQGGLRVERVDVRRPAVQEEVDDTLGLAPEMRRLGGQRIAVRPGAGGPAQGSFVGEQAGEAQRAQAQGRAPQEFPAVQAKGAGW
jgi:hypothetical protein